MNIVLWIIQVLLALFCLAGGSWKLFSFDPSAAPATAALPVGVWKFLGVVELLCALGLILPAAFKKLPVFTPVAASILAVEGVFLALFDARYDTRFVMTNPMVYALIQLAEATFIAYGRFVLKPF